MSVRVELHTQLKLNKTLSLHTFQQLKTFNSKRHDGSQFPDVWCQWVPTEDGNGIEWDGGEGFSQFLPWLKFLIETFLEPQGYKLTGIVLWEYPEDSEIGTIHVVNNKLRVIKGQHVTLKALDTMKPGEAFINAHNGEKLVFPSFDSSPSGVDYVRFVNANGDETAYWDASEWAEDPRGVMGAILGALMRGTSSVEVEITDEPESV